MPILHPFPPVISEDSEILILGSFPSVQSRNHNFYYAHPQNRFWKVLASVYGENVPESIPQKKQLLAKHRIALWDVIASCEISGSADHSIRGAIPNPVGTLLAQYPIQRIFTNGSTAYRLYMKEVYPMTVCPARGLPSTSPANAAYSLERLCIAWRDALLDSQGS